MSVFGLLNTTCDVYAKTESVSSSSGGNVFAFSGTAAYTNVPCTVQQPNARNDDRWSREGQQRTPTLYILWEDRAKIANGQRVTVAADGLTYAVTSDPNDDAGRNAYARYSLEYLAGGGVR